MPNHGRGRPSRRRGFDDDFSFDRPGFDAPRFEAPGAAPRTAASMASGPEVQARVKWFSTEKGFGFVELADGTGDAFLHVNTLGTTGQSSVAPGATLTVRVGQGQKGKQVAQVVAVDSSTAAPEPPRGAGRTPVPRRAAASGPAVAQTGSVKWYNASKGFGFVAVADGGKDVFVHATVLQRAGLADLAEGQAVAVDVVQGAKGPEASAIRLA